MATHFDDEEQIANLKAWWADNWKALTAGLVIGLAAIGGWQGWTAYKEHQSLGASQMYEDLKTALSQSRSDEARQIGAKLRSQYAGTPYAAAAALRLAQLAVQDNQLDEAASQLGWVADRGGDPALRQLAKLRLARVLWQQDKADEALKQLQGDAGEYESLYQELRGDIAYARGDRETARKAYEAALQSAPEPAANRPLLQQKLDDLAVAADPVKS